MTIAVLGAGSWGTAISALLADAGATGVRLWGRDEGAVAALAATRENRRYLPGRRIPDAVEIVSDLARAVEGADALVFALPAACVRAVAVSASRAAPRAALAVCASKGLEESTHLTLDRVLGEALESGRVGPQGQSGASEASETRLLFGSEQGRPAFRPQSARVALLSGPTFAVELARGLPAAAVAASRDKEAARDVQRLFGSERFRVYTTEDVVGVAIGGALKNVIAIAAGCADGLGFGHNARAALITRGLNELGRLAVRLGGNPLTLAGLAGLGDLVLTCTGELSRNRRVGLALAAGEPLEAITARLGQIAEGVATARVADELARELGVDMPITAQVAAVLAGKRTPREAVADLLARESGAERG